MAITISEVVERLRESGYQVMAPEGPEAECGLRFSTRCYVDGTGQQSLLIVCRLSDDGQYLEIFAPALYAANRCKYRMALFAAMLELAYRTKHVQVEHDPRDGEIRFAIDLPVCDGTVTARQLDAMVGCLVRMIDVNHPVLVHAMEKGVVDFNLAWTPPAADGDETEADSRAPMPPELAELIAKAGGIERVEALLVAHRSSTGDGE